MWQALIKPIADLAGGWIKGKIEEKKAIQEARIQRIKTDSDWEARMAEASGRSWKDEYLIIILTLPVIFVGYGVAVDDPQIIERVRSGFETLTSLPEWYQYLLFIGVSASFGLKSADKIMALRKNRSN